MKIEWDGWCYFPSFCLLLLSKPKTAIHEKKIDKTKTKDTAGKEKTCASVIGSKSLF